VPIESQRAAAKKKHRYSITSSAQQKRFQPLADLVQRDVARWTRIIKAAGVGG
jgi:hypothetical protein